MRTQQKNALVMLGVTVLILLLLARIIQEDMDRVQGLIASSGWVGLLVMVGIYGILGASPIPSEPFTLVLSAISGPFHATLVAGAGNLLAALVEYFIGDKVGEVAEFEKRRDQLPLGLGRLPVNSPSFLILARMLPYTAKIVSLLSGIYGVSVWRYIWTTAVSTFLGAAMIAYGGFGLLSLWEKFWLNIVK